MTPSPKLTPKTPPTPCGDFFDNIVLPELAYPRVKYGLCPVNLSEAKRGHKCDRGQITKHSYLEYQLSITYAFLN